jgi:adhesin HecA-like repeat protein
MPGEFAMYTDISERKQRERELYRQNERLERFASVVSHDLRNPLNVATTRLELAQAECESDHLDDVAQAHDRIDTLIDDILTLARGGEQVREPETVDIADTIDSCWRNVGTAEATLVTETEQTIDAEPSRLKQLLENLFRTAAEHAGDDVTVTVGELDNRDGFYVADDGPGIPADKRDEVFEAGYSTHEIFVEYPVDNGIPNS